jgi:hypothetical protein
MCGRGRRWLDPVSQKCKQATATLGAAVRRATPLVSRVLLEGVSGAVVAVMLAVAVEAPNVKKSPVVPAAALAGAVMGSLLALTQRRREKAATEDETAGPGDSGASLSS